VDKLAILKKLRASRDNATREAIVLLQNDDAVPLFPAPADVTVNEAMHLWRVRQKSSASRGHELEGAETLLIKLHGLAPQRKLQQFVFKGSRKSGNLFFEKTTGQYVGAILVNVKQDS
jgi:hypothetical protein